MTEERRYYCCRMLSKNRGRSSRYSDIAKVMEQKKYLLREKLNVKEWEIWIDSLIILVKK